MAQSVLHTSDCYSARERHTTTDRAHKSWMYSSPSSNFALWRLDTAAEHVRQKNTTTASIWLPTILPSKRGRPRKFWMKPHADWGHAQDDMGWIWRNWRQSLLVIVEKSPNMCQCMWLDLLSDVYDWLRKHLQILQCRHIAPEFAMVFLLAFAHRVETA